MTFGERIFLSWCNIVGNKGIKYHSTHRTPHTHTHCQTVKVLKCLYFSCDPIGRQKEENPVDSESSATKTAFYFRTQSRRR